MQTSSLADSQRQHTLGQIFTMLDNASTRSNCIKVFDDHVEMGPYGYLVTMWPTLISLVYRTPPPVHEEKLNKSSLGPDSLTQSMLVNVRGVLGEQTSGSCSEEHT